MKALLPLLLLILTVSEGMSQSGSVLNFSGTYSDQKVPDELKKGNVVVGLNGLGNYRNTMSARKSTWSLTGQSGYMIANRVILGAQASLARDIVESKSGASSSAGDFQYYSLAPEVYSRYYFTLYRVKPFVQLSTGYNFQWGEEQEGNGRKLDVSAQHYVASGAIGLSFLLNRKIMAEVMYNHRFIGKSTFEDPNKLLKIRVGVSIMFR